MRQAAIIDLVANKQRILPVQQWPTSVPSAFKVCCSASSAAFVFTKRRKSRCLIQVQIIAFCSGALLLTAHLHLSQGHFAASFLVCRKHNDGLKERMAQGSSRCCLTTPHYQLESFKWLNINRLNDENAGTHTRRH